MLKNPQIVSQKSCVKKRPKDAQPFLVVSGRLLPSPRSLSLSLCSSCSELLVVPPECRVLCNTLFYSSILTLSLPYLLFPILFG